MLTEILLCCTLAGGDGKGAILCNCVSQWQDRLPSWRAGDGTVSVRIEIWHEDESSTHVHAWRGKGRSFVALFRCIINHRRSAV